MFYRHLQIYFILILLMQHPACGQNQPKKKIIFRELPPDAVILTGAEQTKKYFPLLKNKIIAVAANQTSMIRSTHLVDTLAASGFSIKCVFAPEHGFRGEAGAGEHIGNSVDVRTNIPVVSLYGTKKKPYDEDLYGVDVVVFDIQDVGARFYTYLSTLQYIMEACAVKNITVLVLDRPNPNGYYVDGPVLEKPFASFVGLNPIPVVHGLTVGEYAQMLNGEGWLAGKMKCPLKVIPCRNYSHRLFYKLPVKPSPNLPNMASVYLYPSLCLFEGTAVSVGRGTPFPFQVAGFPGFAGGEFRFTPVSLPGIAVKPPYENTECAGIDLRDFGEEYIKNYSSIYLFWLTGFYKAFPDKEKFFNDFFDKLAGTDKLRQQIISGMTEEQIRQSWQKDLANYKALRKKYLLYEDFE